MNKPSIKTLRQAFPESNAATLRKLLDSAEVVRNHPAAIALDSACLNPPTLAMMRLAALDDEIKGYGVEYVSGIGSSQSFEYINMGDTYATTIVRFNNGRYCVADIGSIIERGNYE